MKINSLADRKAFFVVEKALSQGSLPGDCHATLAMT